MADRVDRLDLALRWWMTVVIAVPVIPMHAEPDVEALSSRHGLVCGPDDRGERA